MRRRRTIMVGGVAVLLLAAALATLLWLGPPRSGAERRSLAAAFPLMELVVTDRPWARPEIHAALHPRVRLVDVISMDVLGQFEAGLSPERALTLHGRPAGTWVDPIWGSESPYYETEFARISLGQFHGSDGRPGWKTVAYPKRRDLAAVVVDEALRKQLIGALPEVGEADVVVARPIGAGRVELFASRTECRAIMWLEGGS